MKKIEERKLSMYEVTRDLLLATDSTIIDLMPLMEDYRTTLVNNIASISNYGGEQKLNRKGFADEKEVLRNILTTKASDVSRKVQGYAVNIQDLVLLKEIKYSEAALNKLPDNVVVIACTIIYDYAKIHLAELDHYGITEITLVNLKSAINNYDTAIPKPRAGIVIKKGATLNIKQLFSATDMLLKNQLDLLVGIVKESHPLFYINYFNSRKIINPAHNTLAVRCRVIDEMENPIADVVALVKETSNSFKTKEKGQFFIKSFAQGSYHFTFSKAGYASKTINVAVTNGERTEIKVTLVTNT